MISHNEAQTLISARQDQVLDPIVEHELNAHLATCDSCRAFAQSTEQLTMGLRALPYFPASPAVRRAVLDRVEEGRSPWGRLAGAFNTAPGPALSTLAIIALVMIVGFFALNRFVLQDQGGSGDQNRQLASQPTEQALATEQAEFTVTPEPTDAAATEASTEPTSLLADDETATEAATEVPTDEPATEIPTEVATEVPATEPATEAPTATTPPAPTETPVPTEVVETPEPTAPPTEEPVEPTADASDASNSTLQMVEESTPEATAEEGVIADLTVPESTPVPTATPSPTTEPTPPPTAAATATATATATLEPTPEPTATATATPEPTPEPTATAAPTATSDPTATTEPTVAPSPPIVPIDGNEPVDATEPEEEDTGGAAASEPATDTKSNSEVPKIEPIDGQTVVEPDSAATEAPAATEAAVEDIAASDTETIEAQSGETIDLVEASVAYQDIAGEPGGRLLLTSEGRMVLGSQPHAPDMVTPAGRTLDTIDAEGGSAVGLCYEDGACVDVSSGSREGAAEDRPLGTLDGEVIYLRISGDVVEYRRTTVDGDTVVADDVLYSGDSTAAPQDAVYQEEGRLFIPTASGAWVMLTGSEGTLLPSDFAAPQLVRFAPTPQGFFVGFISNGQLIVAQAEAPGSPVVAMPFNGVDFDISPNGDQIVVSTGTTVDIYDMSGARTASYSNPDRTPGTVLWLNSGIVYVDDNTGALYQLPETAI